VGVCQQPDGAMEVVLRILRNNQLQIDQGGGEIVQPKFGQRPTVVRMQRVRPSGSDHLVIELPRAREPPFVQILVGELFEVADGRVVEDRRFEIADSAPASHRIEGAAQQARIRNNLGDDVDERAETAADENDPEPVGLGPAPDEMQNSDGLQDKSPRIEQANQAHTSGPDYNMRPSGVEISVRHGRFRSSTRPTNTRTRLTGTGSISRGRVASMARRDTM